MPYVVVMTRVRGEDVDHAPRLECISTELFPNRLISEQDGKPMSQNRLMMDWPSSSPAAHKYVFVVHGYRGDYL